MEKQIAWTVAAISEFAKAKELSPKQAFNYLSLFKGMDFLEAHYGAEHLPSGHRTAAWHAQWRWFRSGPPPGIRRSSVCRDSLQHTCLS